MFKNFQCFKKSGNFPWDTALIPPHLRASKELNGVNLNEVFGLDSGLIFGVFVPDMFWGGAELKQGQGKNELRNQWHGVVGAKRWNEVFKGEDLDF